MGGGSRQTNPPLRHEGKRPMAFHPSMLSERQLGSLLAELFHEPGEPIPGRLRPHFERAFGCKFDRVRIHRGPRAAELAQSAAAPAVTVGEHIVLGPVEIETATGLGVLARELGQVLRNRRDPWGELCEPGAAPPPSPRL